jgi:tetratricopeptide (TPR) repeat protein
LKKGKSTLAIRDFTRVRNKRPEIFRDCLTQSDFFRVNRDFQRSLELIDIRLHLDPENYVSYKHRAITHSSMSNYDLALRDFDEALRTTPQSHRMTRSFAIIYSLRGIVYLQCGELDQALADCLKATQIVPDEPQFLLNLGTVYSARGDSDLAIEHWQSVLNSEDIDTRDFALTNLSAEYGRRREADKAIEYADAAIQRDPDNYVAILNRGRAHRMKGELRQAIEDLSRAIDIYPERDGFFERAGALFDAGEWIRAKTDYDKAIELDPWFALAYVNRAITRAKLHELEQAMDDVSRAIQLHPSGKAYYRRGMLRAMEFSEYALAIDDFTKCLECADDEVNTAHVLYTRAACYSRTGKSRAAVADAEKALELCPDRMEYLNVAAWMLVICPDTNEEELNRACEFAEKAMAMAPNNPDTRSSMGAVLYYQGKYDETIMQVRKAQELRTVPNPIDGLLLAMACWKQGSHDMARQQFTQAVSLMDQGHEDAESRRFRAEAAALLGIDKAD